MSTKNLSTAFNCSGNHARALIQAKFVEMVPTSFVAALANPDPSSIPAQEENFDGPFIIAVSYRDGACRLETGNQHIQACLEQGVKSVPVTVRMAERAILDERNGTHSFTRDLVFATSGPSNHPGEYPRDPRHWRAPSEVFVEIRQLKQEGKISLVKEQTWTMDSAAEGDWIQNFINSPSKRQTLPSAPPEPKKPDPNPFKGAFKNSAKNGASAAPAAGSPKGGSTASPAGGGSGKRIPMPVAPIPAPLLPRRTSRP